MISFVETRLFTRLVLEFLSEDEYRRVQAHLIRNPDAGSVVRGSGGVRKLRWPAPGRGKRGGYRLIYFVKRDDGVIWMLTIYPKNVREVISPKLLKQIRQEIEDE